MLENWRYLYCSSKIMAQSANESVTVWKSRKKKEFEAVHLKSLAFLEKLVPDRKGQIELPI